MLLRSLQTLTRYCSLYLTPKWHGVATSLSMRAIKATKAIKNADSIALFLSVTAAAELLGFNNNSFVTAGKAI